jgi:acyl-CoA dehydrogenase
MTNVGTLLAESARRLFERHKGVSATRDWPEDLWRQLDGLGTSLTLVEESCGGASGSWLDAFPVLALVGLHSVPLPIAESMLAAKLVATADIEILPGIYSVATKLHGEWRGGGGGGHRFSGELTAVPWGRYADHVVCVVDEGSVVRVHVLPRAAAHTSPGSNLAGEPRDRLTFDDVHTTSAISACVVATRLFDFCALARLPQIAGGVTAALDMSIQYATERKQFGRAIGQFQAVQQQLAQLACEAAAVSCAARAACRAADFGDAGFQIAAAKLRANQAIGLATAIAHQVHGAIGFTQDHALHHITGRLWSWRSEFGNDRYWSERLGAGVARAGPAAFWTDLTARDDAVG